MKQERRWFNRPVNFISDTLTLSGLMVIATMMLNMAMDFAMPNAMNAQGPEPWNA